MASGDIEKEPVLLRRVEGGVVTLTLNRPKHYNALSDALLAALKAEFDAIAADPDARCVVIEGAGKAFCAGHDLKEMRANPSFDYQLDLFARCAHVMTSITALPVPVIAKVHGVATAAGCQLVATCDLAIAARSARFAASGVNLGLFCSTPSVALSRSISAKHAFDLLVTGRFIDAGTALDWGLVNEVADDDALDAVIAAKAAVIISKNRAAIRYGKEMYARQRQMPLVDAYAYAGEVMARNMMEEETCAAIDAFIGKR
jgi:enoyl-CoA hydratase/carnithine racemase